MQPVPPPCGQIRSLSFLVLTQCLFFCSFVPCHFIFMSPSLLLVCPTTTHSEGSFRQTLVMDQRPVSSPNTTTTTTSSSSTNDPNHSLSNTGQEVVVLKFATFKGSSDYTKRDYLEYRQVRSFVVSVCVYLCGQPTNLSCLCVCPIHGSRVSISLLRITASLLL